jgi:hypothetical protein
MKTQPAFVGSKRRVELHTEAPVDAHLPRIVHPRNPENDLPLRLAKPLDQGMIGVAWMLGDNPAKTFQNFPDGLVKFVFPRIPAQNLCKNGLQLLIYMNHGISIPISEDCGVVLA